MKHNLTIYCKCMFVFVYICSHFFRTRFLYGFWSAFGRYFGSSLALFKYAFLFFVDVFIWCVFDVFWIDVWPKCDPEAIDILGPFCVFFAHRFVDGFWLHFGTISVPFFDTFGAHGSTIRVLRCIVISVASLSEYVSNCLQPCSNRQLVFSIVAIVVFFLAGVSNCLQLCSNRRRRND